MAPPEKQRKKIYPVQFVSPPSAEVHYEDETTTLEPPRLVNFYLTGVGFKVKEPKARYGKKGTKSEQKTS